MRTRRSANMQLALLLTEIGNAVVLGGPVVPYSHVT